MDEYAWQDLMSSIDPSQTATGGLSLGALSLSQPIVDQQQDWGALTTTPTMPTASAPTTGSYSGGTGGGWGPSAYGYHGTTGLDSNRGGGKYGLQSNFWSALSSAFGDMQRAGVGRPGVTDGFRPLGHPGDGAGNNPYTQYGVRARKPGISATPGSSVHGLGLAADLNLTGAQQRWLERNGAKYGLGRLPSEAWHWQLLPSAYKNGAPAPARKPTAGPTPAAQASSNLRLMRLGL